MTNTLKVQKLAITAFITVVMAFLFLNLFTVQAHAAGLLDETIDTAHEFSKYPIDNYQLDFYVDSSWDWLPWNWLDGIGKTAQYAIYLFTNFLWTLNLYISNAVGYLIQQAYDLDFISSAASEIGKNIQLIAGVSASGFDSAGLFPGMMAIVTLLVGVYCTYVGLVKRETTKAFHAALNFVVVFVVSVGLIAYAPSAITGVNEFSSDISNGIVDVSAKILAPDAAGENTGVSAIRDCLFGIQVQQPWLIMQFGDSDVENIGEERVNSLLGTSPDENRGKDREEVVKTELEDYDNGNLTVTEVTSRFGLSVFFLIFNLIVSAFAIMLTGSMLLSQILFIISAMFLPVSLLISMIPAFSGTSRRAVISLFNTIMLRVGTTLLTTFVLVLSSLAYTIANGKPFVVVVLLQVIVFAGVYMERDKLLGMIGLRDEGTGRVGRAMTNRPRRTISRAVRKALPFAAGVGVGKRSAQRRAVQSTQRTASTSANRESASRETVQPEKKNLGQRVGETAGKIADTPSRVRDKAAETVQKVKDVPTNAEYAVRSNVESARESVLECRNVGKRVLHRWNLVELPLQAAGNSYLSAKKNVVREMRRSPERKALVLHQRSAQLSPNSRILNRKSRLHRRIGLGRNGLNRHQNSGKIARRSRTSRRLWWQTGSWTVRQNVRRCRTSRKHDTQCQKDWTKKRSAQSSNSGKPEKLRTNSGVPRAEVSENDEKGGNGRCPGLRTADCFTSVDVSDYCFG